MHNEPLQNGFTPTVSPLTLPTSPLSSLNDVSPISPTTTASSSTSITSRAQRIQSYLETQVPQWKDDSLCQSLFAGLPHPETKPEAYQQKLTFWKDLLTSMVRSQLIGGGGSVLRLSFSSVTDDLSSKFKRKGIQPICLSSIISEMLRAGLAEEYTGNHALIMNKTTRSSSFFSMVFSSLWSLVGNESSNAAVTNGIHDTSENLDSDLKMPKSLLLIPLLKEQVEMILDYLRDSFGNDSGDIGGLDSLQLPLTFEEFQRLIVAARHREGLGPMTEREDFKIVLQAMKAEGLLNYASGVGGTDEVLAIKLKQLSHSNNPREPSGTMPTLTSMDLNIARIKHLHARLQDQIQDLSQRMTDLHKSARFHLTQRSDRQMATYQLRRRKLLETLQSQRMSSLHSIEEVLWRIRAAADDSLIVEAYRQGTVILKSLLPNQDEVVDVMDDLQSVLADQNEITQIISSQSMDPSGLEISDFERELEELMKSDASSSASVNVSGASPATSATSLKRREMEKITSALEEFHVGDKVMTESKNEVAISKPQPNQLLEAD